MAVRLLLRRGPAEALKTVLLEVPVFRGPASTVSRSAQSGKNEKELPANPRKQSPPKKSAEPYDNTTYKNLQHHDYNTYTFLDLNLNLSKFRLPQPSSGRESPRH
ncbi:NADH dehydrogenase [ubiquinone] flavoprotein 3, mitochondrial isoform X2 [Cavia porcellus]|uniref:NADH dehydrogenase [ubiquinone] flavoprotein 3, mitochondrial n=1 Tax=Cavia porcellus TaxID=10141 RepID=A0A286XSF6_CAVPO|nr:NADH dehydrogenase [ubiquinone] flavoprotein 3, mitochondrial isoform X2 [Cavia porcellus]